MLVSRKGLNTGCMKEKLSLREECVWNNKTFNFNKHAMLELIIPNYSHKDQWEEIIAEWDDTRKRPRILFQPSFEEFINRISQLSR